MPRLDGAAAIDRLRDPDGVLSRAALRSILPYGDDFLFVDRVTRLSRDEIVSTYRVPAGGPFLAAHFEDFPVMPAALIAEGCAQAGTVLVRYNLEAGEPRDIVALRIDSARFIQPAFPGMELRFDLRLLALRRRLARLEGRVRVEERRLGAVRMDLGIVSTADFRALKPD